MGRFHADDVGSCGARECDGRYAVILGTRSVTGIQDVKYPLAVLDPGRASHVQDDGDLGAPD